MRERDVTDFPEPLSPTKHTVSPGKTLKLISFQENNKNNLISLAIKKSNSRVVVKEPKHSLSNILKPEYTIKTKLLNFNIYKGNNG